MRFHNTLARIACGLMCPLLFSVTCAQNPRSGSTGTDPNQPSTANPQGGTFIRDPQTGRWYRQELVTVAVPTTKWEAKPVTHTVLEPSVVRTNLVAREDIFVPQTELAWQMRQRGRLNPFRKTSYSFEYGPVTRWVPSSNAVAIPMTTQHWTVRYRTTNLYQRVQSVQMQQRLVQTEVAAPQTVPAFQSNPTARYARQPRALIRLPLLAQQNSSSPASQQRPFPSGSSLRPISNTAQRTGQPASVQTARRDSIQMGMSATILR